MTDDGPTGLRFAALVAATGANALLAVLALVALRAGWPITEENLLIVLAIAGSYALSCSRPSCSPSPVCSSAGGCRRAPGRGWRCR